MSRATFEDTNPMHRRGDEPFIKISREVPLWSIVTGLGGILLQAVLLYSNQLHQSDTLVAQALTIKEMAAQIGALSTQIGDANIKATGYEVRITELERRLTFVETGNRIFDGQQRRK